MSPLILKHLFWKASLNEPFFPYIWEEIFCFFRKLHFAITSFLSLLRKWRHWWTFLVRVVMWRVHERSCIMWMENMKLLTLFMAPLLMGLWFTLSFMKSTINSLVILRLFSVLQSTSRCSVECLATAVNQTYHSSVICILIINCHKDHFDMIKMVTEWSAAPKILVMACWESPFAWLKCNLFNPGYLLLAVFWWVKPKTADQSIFNIKSCCWKHCDVVLEKSQGIKRWIVSSLSVNHIAHISLRFQCCFYVVYIF